MGKPYFKKWTWVLLDENTALAALESGDVDMIYATPELADKKSKAPASLTFHQMMCAAYHYLM